MKIFRMALLGAVIVLAGATMAAAEPDRFDITAWTYIGEYDASTESIVPYVSENEQAILDQLGFTRIYRTYADTGFVTYCNSTGGTIRMVVMGIPEGECDTLCWYPDPDSCITDQFCGSEAMTYLVDSAHLYTSDPRWQVIADQGMQTILDFWGDQPGIAGFHLADEVWGPSRRPGMNYMAGYLHANKPNPNYTVAFSGANTWVAMNYNIFDELSNIDYWEVFDYPFHRTSDFAGTAYQDNWDITKEKWDTVINEMKVYGLGNSRLSLGTTVKIYDDMPGRVPTPAEVRFQALLALARGTRGYEYFSIQSPATRNPTILTEGWPRVKRYTPLVTYPGGGYFIYDAVAEVNHDLLKLGPYMMNLYPDTTFLSQDPNRPEAFVDSVSGDYFDVGVLTDVEDDIGRRYFVVANRICNNADGSPADPRLAEVFLDIYTPDGDHILPVVDLLHDDTLSAYACNGLYVLRLPLEPGGGGLYKVLDTTMDIAGTDNDGDGIDDGCDNCPDLANAGQEDSDGDGIGDDCDTCPDDFWNDQDNDGLCADVDPCPLDPDNDIDGDGLCGDIDNCPDVSNPSQSDTDNDGFGDACDNCDGGYVSLSDRDLDGSGDGCDNCPDLSNAAQLNEDGDRWGDACDLCPDLYYPGNEGDMDSDGRGDMCDFVFSGSDTACSRGSNVAVPIYGENHAAIYDILLPIQLSFVPFMGVTLDSISFVGGRLEHFEVQEMQYSEEALQVYFLIADNGGGSEPLSPGAGLLATAHMTIPNYAFVGETIVLDFDAGASGFEFEANSQDDINADRFRPQANPVTITVRDWDDDGDGIDNYADCELVPRDTFALPGDTVCIEIFAENHGLIEELTIPITLTNVPTSFLLDSVSFVGTRVAYFESKSVTFDNRFAGQVAYKIVADVGGGAPALPPGSGLLAKVFLRSKITATVGDSTVLDLENPAGSQVLSGKALTNAGILPFTPQPFGSSVEIVSSPCTCLFQCDFNEDAFLDAVDLNAEIDALFFNGENPQDANCPATRADFNNDTFPDATDLNLLIDHLFFNGSTPVDPCQ